MQQQLTMAAPQDVYYSSRSEALHNVEATIVELGGIFQQLAHMVRPSANLQIPMHQLANCAHDLATLDMTGTPTANTKIPSDVMS
jgi:hypothetical protein